MRKNLRAFLIVILFVLVGGIFSGLLIRPAYLQTNRTRDYQVLVSSMNEDVESVGRLLRRGVDPNTPPGPNDKGMTALMFAAWKGNAEITGLLLDAGANPNAIATNGSSPLIFAAATGNAEVVRLLLRKGANPNYVSSNGSSAVLAPLAKRNHEVVRTLSSVTDGAVLDNLRINDTPLIVVAVKATDPELVAALPLTKLNLELTDADGQTALMHAARGGHTRIVSKLIRAGAQVNARDPNGVTALTKAVIGSRIAVIQVLRANGATP